MAARVWLAKLHRKKLQDFWNNVLRTYETKAFERCLAIMHKKQTQYLSWAALHQCFFLITAYIKLSKLKEAVLSFSHDSKRGLFPHSDSFKSSNVKGGLWLMD